MLVVFYRFLPRVFVIVAYPVPDRQLSRGAHCSFGSATTSDAMRCLPFLWCAVQCIAVLCRGFRLSVRHFSVLCEAVRYGFVLRCTVCERLCGAVPCCTVLRCVYVTVHTRLGSTYFHTRSNRRPPSLSSTQHSSAA